MAQNLKFCQFCETSTIIKWKCVNCDLILCEDCKTKIHSKVQTSEKHKIIDLKEFDTASAAETIRSLDVKNIPCTNHANEKCIFYCHDCEVLLCSLCLIKSLDKHANHKLGKIEDVYQLKLQDIKDLKVKANDLMMLFSEKEKDLDQVLSMGYAINQKLVARDAKIKQIITQQLENLVKELNDLWKPQEDQIVQELREIREKNKDLNQCMFRIKETLHSQKAMSIFTACDTTRGIRKDLPEVPAMQSSIKQIILLQPRPEETVSLGLLRTVPRLEVTESYHSELKRILRIKTKDDGTEILCCESSKILCKFELKNSKCLTASLAEEIEIVDMAFTKQGKLLFSVSFDSEVKCLTGLSSDTAIEKFTSISPLYARAIYATDKNILIGFCDDGYLFSHTKDSRKGIIVQDYNGRQIRTLEYDTNNDKIFTLPERITTSSSGDICVVDSEKCNWEGRVVVLSELGSVKWTYKGHYSINTDHEFTPLDLVTTDEGFMLVADRDSNAIHLLSMEGDLLTLSLSDRHGIEKPLCLNIDNSGKLMIGCSSIGTKENEAKLHVVEYIV